MSENDEGPGAIDDRECGEAPADVEVDAAGEGAGRSSRFPFGPEFFLIHLRSYVRDRCPNPEEALPLVEVRLADASVLDLCHVIAVTERWLALAVRENPHDAVDMQMHTELVPYELICRVTIRSRSHGSARVGFDASHEPVVGAGNPRGECSPEGALAAARRPIGS